MIKNKVGCIFILINCFFMLVGCLFLGLGLGLKYGPNTHRKYELGEQYSNRKYNMFVSGVKQMLALGSVMLIVSVFGNYGAGKMRRCPLRMIVEFSVLLSHIYTESGDTTAIVTLTTISSMLYCCGLTGGHQNMYNDTCSEDSTMLGCPMSSAKNLSIFIVTGLILFTALICSTILLKRIKTQQQNEQRIRLTRIQHTRVQPAPVQPAPVQHVQAAYIISVQRQVRIMA